MKILIWVILLLLNFFCAGILFLTGNNVQACINLFTGSTLLAAGMYRWRE